jgi:hypothetical protein
VVLHRVGRFEEGIEMQRVLAEAVSLERQVRFGSDLLGTDALYQQALRGAQPGRAVRERESEQAREKAEQDQRIA